MQNKNAPSRAAARRRRRPSQIAAALISIAVLAGPGSVSAKPARIVSLNLCTDELVLRLAEPSRVASVTWLAREPGSSNVVREASAVAINYGSAEEVAAEKPDLVVAGRYTARPAVSMLARTGISVNDFDVPQTLDGVREQIRAMAMLLGEPEKGARLIDSMDRRLAAVPPPPNPRPRALVLNPNGATVGRGTLVDEILSRAGLDNMAPSLGVDSYGLVPLETVIRSAPDVLIVGASGNGPPAMAMELLRHPAIAKAGDRIAIVRLPMGLLSCGGPAVLDAIEYLRAVAETAAQRRAAP